MLRDVFENMEDMTSWLFGTYSPREHGYMCGLMCGLICSVVIFVWSHFFNGGLIMSVQKKTR